MGMFCKIVFLIINVFLVIRNFNCIKIWTLF